MLIGLSGYARSGKDTMGAFLVEERGFTRIAFADALKHVLYALDPLVPFKKDGFEFIRLKNLIDMYGWESAKNPAVLPQATINEIRGLQQRMGTEAGRKIIGDNVWVETALRPVQPDDNYVVTDCRFPNESQAVEDAGGFMVRIDRAGILPVNAHESETALDHWPFNHMISNNGTLEDLKRKALYLVDKIL